jgi:hypothetical protein
MNVRSKVAVVLLVAVVLCPLAICAVSGNQAGQESHPCCPPGKSHQSRAQQSDCKCIATQPPAPVVMLNGGSVPLGEAPVALAAADPVVISHYLVSTPVPLSDQDTFIAIHQFRI